MRDKVKRIFHFAIIRSSSFFILSCKQQMLAFSLPPDDRQKRINDKWHPHGFIEFVCVRENEWKREKGRETTSEKKCYYINKMYKIYSVIEWAFNSVFVHLQNLSKSIVQTFFFSHLNFVIFFSFSFLSL